MAGTATVTKRSSAGIGQWGLLGIPIDFVADAVDASFPDVVLPAQPGALVEVGIAEDAAVPPDTLALSINDIDGLDILKGSGAIINESKRLSVSPPAPFTPGITVTLSGNSVVSAAVRIILYLI